MDMLHDFGLSSVYSLSLLLLVHLESYFDINWIFLMHTLPKDGKLLPDFNKPFLFAYVPFFKKNN